MDNSMDGGNLVELYEMGMCSDPRVENVPNPVLREVNAIVKALESEGVRVVRYLPTENMTVFMRNPKVAALIFQQRWKVLPVTMVNGDVIKVESYPTLEEIRAALSLRVGSEEAPGAGGQQNG